LPSYHPLGADIARLLDVKAIRPPYDAFARQGELDEFPTPHPLAGLDRREAERLCRREVRAHLVDQLASPCELLGVGSWLAGAAACRREREQRQETRGSLS
jgi:hypothetical protein